MSKKFLVAMMFSGYAYAAAPSISIRADLPANKPLCPFLDTNLRVTYTDDENEGKQAVLTIQCAAAGAQQKTTRFTSQPVTLVKKVEPPKDTGDKKKNDYDDMDSFIATQNLPYASFTVDVLTEISSAAVGDDCTATVAISDNANRKASGDFKIGFRRIGEAGKVAGKPGARVLEPITIGQEFRIGSLFVHGSGIPFVDLVLRECTAAEDPWIFKHSGSSLDRVYPISITSSKSFGQHGDIDPSNDNLCLGMYDGFIGGLFTLGQDHAGCKIKLIKDAVVGGDSFTAMGAPTLAAAASVTTNAGAVLLNTGAKPASPNGISNSLVVYISTNRGQTWQSSTINSWVNTATATGVNVSTTSSTDNTANMAVIGITDNTNTNKWWRIIKGQ